MKSLLDPSFKYTSSANTDIRKTFARARREMRQAKEAQAKEATRKVIAEHLDLSTGTGKVDFVLYDDESDFVKQG